MRRLPFALTILVLSLFIPSLKTEAGTYRYTFGTVRIKDGDGIIFFIKPVVNSLIVAVNEIKGSGHILYVRSNDSALITEYISPPYSFIELIPRGDNYNVTIMFTSNSNFSIHYGIITSTPAENYPGRAYHRIFDVAYVPFPAVSGFVPGDYTIVFQFYVDKKESPSSWIKGIVIPPLANLLGFLTMIVGVVYLESFILITTLFKTRSTGLSTAWKLGVILSIALSAYLIYWAYLRLSSIEVS